jgi:hypothetical protein
MNAATRNPGGPAGVEIVFGRSTGGVIGGAGWNLSKRLVDGHVALFVKQIAFRPEPKRAYASAGTWNRGRSTVKMHPLLGKLRA